jgi:O-acetyl-ADP-ribose deacetylase (regulator of RNase III)
MNHYNLPLSFDTFEFKGKQLVITAGDITTFSANAFVSSDDTDLSMSGGVSAAIRRAGGENIWDEAMGASHLCKKRKRRVVV